MNQYRITFKRIENFYHDILIDASTEEEARSKADQLSFDCQIDFDYLGDSELIDEHIVQIEKL